MNRLEKCFEGIAVGDRCTGTVNFFSLNSTELLKDGVIQIVENTLIAPATEKFKPVYGYDYVFCGFRE